MNLSFRQAKNIGIASLVGIILIIGGLSYSIMKKTTFLLNLHAENNKKMELYSDINFTFFKLTDILYNYTRWEKEDLEKIPPLIEDIILKCKELSETDKKNREDIELLMKSARIVKTTSVAYADELDASYRTATLQEMERRFSKAAADAIFQSNRIMKIISSEIQGTDEKLLISTRRTLRLVGIIVFGGMLFGLALAFVVSRALSRPVNRLIESTERIAGGDLKERITIDSSDEIGRLADSFNKMAGSLDRSFTGLKRAEEQIKKSLQEKEILLREIHHRVKNNMQIISSMLILQSASIQDEKFIDILTECQDRIRSMALIHEKLYQTEEFVNINFREYIEAIMQSLCESYRVDKSAIVMKVDAEDIFLDMETAVPIGLIINELVTNAFKHGFKDRKEGEITVILGGIEGNGLELIVRDNGAGLPEGFDIEETKTLGLQIVSLLTQQLKGKISVNRDDGKTEFRIILQKPSYKKRV